MINLLFGENVFLLTREKKELKNKFIKKNFYIEEFDISNNFDINIVKQSVLGVDLFSSKKIIIFDDFITLLKANKLKELYDFIKENKQMLISNEQVELYFFESKPKKSNNFFKFLNKYSSIKKEFKKFSSYEIKNFFKEEVKRIQLDISDNDLNYLISILNQDLWVISNELNKLKNFLIEQKATRMVIDKLVYSSFSKDIFRLIDAVARKDKKNALFLIRKHLEVGENEIYLFTMIVFQFRTLIKISSIIEDGAPRNEISRLLKINPYVVNKNLNLVNKFTLEKLTIIYKKLAQIDYSIKKGAMDGKIALDLFVAFS